MSGNINMPILGTRGTSVIWKPTAEDQAQAKANHSGQSLEKLAERGGVTWEELDAIVAGEAYDRIPRDPVSSCKRVHLIMRHRAEP